MLEDIGEIADMFIDIRLDECQTRALSHLMLLGQPKATTLSKVSGIPSAKIYESWRTSLGSDSLWLN